MDGIIFDLDGTLWDSTQAVADAWNEALEKNTTLDKRVTGAELKTVFGKPLEEIFAILFPSEEKEYLEQLAVMLYEHQHEKLANEGCGTYAGVPEVLEALSKKYPLFIVSNCQAGYIEVFFKATGLETYITDYTCPGDTGMFKAENIRLIMERNALKNIVYVGDTLGDKMACDKAGVPMIHARYGFGDVENAYAEIEQFTELLDIDYEVIHG